VIDRIHVTPSSAHIGPKGDVCPEPTTVDTRLRRLGPIAAPVGAAVRNGGQDGRQAFVVDRREVPT
jgi:hypothetical protein